MKKRIAAAGIGAALLAGSLLGSGSANADSYGFVADIHAYGLFNIWPS